MIADTTSGLPVHRMRPLVARPTTEAGLGPSGPAAMAGAPPAAAEAAPPPLADARSRIEALVDPESFEEFGSRVRHRTVAFDMARKRPAGDGVVTGHARIAGRPIGLFAQDPGALGGSLGEMHAAKILQVMRQAERARTPVVGIIDSGGARIQEGVAALDGYGGIFHGNVRLSGRVPQVSVVLGPCAGGAAYSPALTDIVIMRRTGAHMFLTGPRVVQAVTREDVTAADLGGADVHSRHSGLAHLVADDAAGALELASQVLSYLPGSCWEPAPMGVPAPAEAMPALPDNPRASYDVRRVVRGVVDAGSFLELQPRYARNLVTGFARIEGRPVGVVANQPMALAGVLDIASSEKGARFVRLCDAFGLPLVVLVDTPGFLPGSKQESGGVIRKGAKLLYAFAEATVPRVTVVLRKAFGGAYIVMNSRSLGADAVFCWPDAEMAVMGADAAVDVIFRRELRDAPHRQAELVERYRAEAMAPHLPAERLSVDEIIAPERTRSAVAASLRSLAGAVRLGFRHDNLPQ
ncbi:acyl-CoA carboxylase subunit beta [Micromonospora mirobrigensis]|uniref:Propionyl-CoA carboxylase beta chain n=1 Tax=Micromonospora mirobrigensis TaxID=262898 RepID=A0A1C5A017_9ACTN|nr:acyl-CoA carboxylase subunit beta [Micromonospora mirobrigensis]SCF38441.1 propionyl-CoA carboxylase beta chain [Micromonospora mirobrigensis]